MSSWGNGPWQTPTVMRRVRMAIGGGRHAGKYSALTNRACHSPKTTGDVVIGTTLFGRRKEPLGRADLDQLSQVHERGDIRDPRGLLQVVRDDDDAELVAKVEQRLFDAQRRDRVERRGGLIEEDYLGLQRDRAGDAQALLLTAG